MQSKANIVSDQIDDQWPLRIAVAISPNEYHRRTERVKLVENAFRANISQMPDFIRTVAEAIEIGRQTIVRIGKNKNAPRLVH